MSPHPQPTPLPFAGFALPTSNTTYAPNQFFDVCLPHRSRGCVRLVAYLVRKTLGWCDEHGNPRDEVHAVSYTELERKAGISHEMIRGAIAEAVEFHLVRCVRRPRAKGAGTAGVVGLYELLWDEEGTEYVKDPARFRGFFAGEGNRTYIPNAFFDRVVPHETLAVTKVVGAVIRFSIGFVNKYGHRRRNVALSFQHLQNYARLADRKTLAAAVKLALESNYIERVEEGYFDPDGGKLSRAAVYALKWAPARMPVSRPNEAVEAAIAQKTPPAESPVDDRSENPTGIAPKTPPAGRSENPTGIEITRTNNTPKQQQPQAEAAAATLERLKKEGFDAEAARAIASRYAGDRIERQLAWIGGRKATRNRLGLLRKAIEQDWPEPAPQGPRGRGRQLGRPNSAASPAPSRPSGLSFGAAIEQARQRLTDSAPQPVNSKQP